MTVKIFNVFHLSIDERLIFNPFLPSEIESFFILYGVNADFPQKWITKLNGQTHAADSSVLNMLLEYQLPWHDGSLQRQGFMETSSYVHLYHNQLYLPFDYVGITQYDMGWTSKSLDILRRLNDPAFFSERIVYGISVGTLLSPERQYHPLAFTEHFNWTFLLQSYNRFFRRNWDELVLINKPLTLFQTYLLPQKQFAALAAWLSVLTKEVYPWANQPPYPTHWGVLGGLTERAESLFIAARMAEGAIEFKPWYLHHDESIAQQLRVSKEHYGNKPL